MGLLGKLRYYRKKNRYHLFNREHHTDIRSFDASLDATYGRNVSIEKNVTVSSDVSIGKYTYVNPHTTLENCSIGNYCSISAGVNICPGEHDLQSISTYPLFEREEKEKRAPVIIGHDVLISLNVVVLRGVHIGNGAVIGAGAVVTKDVRPFEIVGGVPAKHIGWRFNEETIRKIEESVWWEKEPDEIRTIQRTLSLDGRNSQGRSKMQTSDQKPQ